ncbi:paraquat-inducible protein A [Puniceibacterium sp. IMCC21224]|uniref:paraquat-inducible protein A n=1 Tax=Puniceibacterium sp. IMCC21224 TaxID=1618204 RepID=UPI00065CC98F|nr:paraquat-inducible protein A [Puniceibacterium sp. IMCC21224]KMK66792.1 Paraquat-inducible protein A [Puniceibacterium sp. IMCC21224]
MTHSDLALEDLIACPQCDALYTARMPEIGERAVCERCHTVLIAPRRKAGLRIIALTLTVLILVISALFFPFLTIHVQGFANQASIMDTASSFGSGALLLLSLATAAMIVLIPLLRMVLVLYVLTPIVMNLPPYAHARHAFRLSQELKPWAMAEIFAIGCAVALVKVASLASIGFGPAFWMFSALVVIVLFNDMYLCNWSVWKSLETDES